MVGKHAQGIIWHHAVSHLLQLTQPCQKCSLQHQVVHPNLKHAHCLALKLPYVHRQDCAAEVAPDHPNVWALPSHSFPVLVMCSGTATVHPIVFRMTLRLVVGQQLPDLQGITCQQADLRLASTQPCRMRQHPFQAMLLMETSHQVASLWRMSHRSSSTANLQGWVRS